MPSGFAQKVLVLDFSVQPPCSLCLWCVLLGNSSTTETQRTRRLHREERYDDFLCKASPSYLRIKRSLLRENRNKARQYVRMRTLREGPKRSYVSSCHGGKP